MLLLKQVRSTCIQRLAEAGLEAREIMSVSGHKNESSLRSYWAPSLDNRKSWSNALFAGPGHAMKRPLEESSSSNVVLPVNTTAPPAQTSGMEFMESYFKNCTFNGSINIFILNPKGFSTMDSLI